MAKKIKIVSVRDALTGEFKPLLNKLPGNGDLEVYYKPWELDPDGQIQEVCQDGNSVILAGISVFLKSDKYPAENTVYKYKKGDLSLALMEMRNNMPIMSIIGHLNTWDKITHETKVLEVQTENLFFPIDEDDEENSLNLARKIVEKLDLTKLLIVTT